VKSKIKEAGKNATFTGLLLEWYKINARQLPWKEAADPYTIWVSEIILQQTRVQQGLPYFHNFIHNFPTVYDLANADEDKLMQVWRGLGYYSRARNMHHTAKQIVEIHDGKFPSIKSELLKLKGIGEYTAAAILSFAFDQPFALVDGNVVRVLSRISALDTPYHNPSGSKLIWRMADELLDKKHPALYNQAIMDFGATWCTPQKPKCTDCFYKDFCKAFQIDKVAQFPVRKISSPKKHRYFIYFVIHDQYGNLAIQKRNDADIWKSLYELPNTEITDFKEFNINSALQTYFDSPKKQALHSVRFLHEDAQVLSHQKIFARFFLIEGLKSLQHTENQFNFENYKNLCNFAFPKIIEKFFASFILPSLK
jgi:A/G-specific adenine glycosylase